MPWVTPRAELAKSKMPKKANHLAREWHETAALLLIMPVTCAPTATRTRDLPLRRRSLYPLSYRGLPKPYVTWDRTCSSPFA
jgi:hypothetical protein